MRGFKRRYVGFRNAFKVCENVIVPKAKHRIPPAFKEGSAARVACAVGMLTSVSLSNQPGLMAHEVGDKRSDWLLPAKLCTCQLRTVKNRPQFAFGIRHYAAKLLRPGQRCLIITDHALTLPRLRRSLPLPQGERE